jgi:hypothetical protein
MKKLGRVVFMSEAEYVELAVAVRSSDKQFREGHQEGYLAGFNAGKFHAAGGYSHALPKLKAELKDATALLERWRPLVAALETTKGQFTRTP